MPDYSWIPKTPGAEPKPEPDQEKREPSGNLFTDACREWPLLDVRFPRFPGGGYRSPYPEVTHTVNGIANATLRQQLKKQCACSGASSGPRLTIKGPKVEGEEYTWTGQMAQMVCDVCDMPWKWETTLEEENV